MEAPVRLSGYKDLHLHFKDQDLIMIGERSGDINTAFVIPKHLDLSKPWLDEVMYIYLGNDNKGYTICRGRAFNRELRIFANLPIWERFREENHTDMEIRRFFERSFNNGQVISI